MVKKTKLTEQQKIQILIMNETMSYWKISEETSIPKSTIYFFIQRFNKFHTILNKKQRGRKSKLISKLDKIDKFFDKNPKATLSSGIDKLGLNAQIKHFQGVCILGYRKYNIPHKPKISPANIKKRLEFTQSHIA